MSRETHIKYSIVGDEIIEVGDNCYHVDYWGNDYANITESYLDGKKWIFSLFSPYGCEEETLKHLKKIVQTSKFKKFNVRLNRPHVNKKEALSYIDTYLIPLSEKNETYTKKFDLDYSYYGEQEFSENELKEACDYLKHDEVMRRDWECWDNYDSLASYAGFVNDEFSEYLSYTFKDGRIIIEVI